MAWKLRKDKLKTDTPDADTPDTDLAAPETTSQAVIAPPPPAPADEPQFTDDAPPAFPRRASPSPAFSDEHQPIPLESNAAEEPQFSDEPQFGEPNPIVMGSTAPIALGAEPELEPIALSAEPELEPIPLHAFTPYQPPEEIATPAPDEPEFEEPSFDAPQTAPIAVAPPPHEPEPMAAPAVAAAPPTEDVPAEAPAPTPGMDREALAPGLVTTDTESGLPRVAPFVLDTPAPEAPVPNAMPSVVLRLGNLSATYFLVKDVTTIGRPDSAVQNYPDIEVELDDGVSRQHAEIRRQGGLFSLVDVGSTNGTILNGQMLTPNQPTPLSPGDRIRIGERTEILFE